MDSVPPMASLQVCRARVQHGLELGERAAERAYFVWRITNEIYYAAFE
jgi:hypothetical protein